MLPVNSLVYTPIEMLLDASLALLGAILIYLMASRGYFSALLTNRVIEKTVELVSDDREREDYLKKVRERRSEELDSAKRDKRKFEHMRDESKKKLLQGQIDQATFRDIIMDAHKGIIEAESHIKSLEGT